MGTHRVALVAVVASSALLAACGDDSGSAGVDAGGDGGGNGDGGDGGMQFQCDYTEMADATNAMLAGAESTGLSTGTTALTICGAINNGHFNTSLEVVDGDFFELTVPTESDLIVHVLGNGIETPEEVLMQINQQGQFDFFGFGSREGNHATIATHLMPGDYTIAVGAVNPTDLASNINYQIRVSLDTPATRCPTTTGTATHAEGTDNGANDVVSFDSARNPESQLTTSTTDSPEATGIAAAPGTSYLVTGSLADVAAIDDYMDRDTFMFTTGTTTDQLTVRLNWPATDADLDFRVYPASTTDPLSIVGGLDNADAEDELETFAVKPNSTYWLWVAAEDGSSAPAAFSATICGETFSP